MAAALNPTTSHGIRALAIPFSLPSFEHLFSGSPVVLSANSATADDKVPGSGDSAGRATNVKAPGGRDARNSRDGG